MSDIAIRVENLSKRYRIGLAEERHDTLAGCDDKTRYNLYLWHRLGNHPATLQHG